MEHRRSLREPRHRALPCVRKPLQPRALPNNPSIHRPAPPPTFLFFSNHIARALPLVAAAAVATAATAATAAIPSLPPPRDSFVRNDRVRALQSVCVLRRFLSWRRHVRRPFAPNVCWRTRHETSHQTSHPSSCRERDAVNAAADAPWRIRSTSSCLLTLVRRGLQIHTKANILAPHEGGQRRATTPLVGGGTLLPPLSRASPLQGAGGRRRRRRRRRHRQRHRRPRRHRGGCCRCRHFSRPPPRWRCRGRHAAPRRGVLTVRLSTSARPPSKSTY